MSPSGAWANYSKELFLNQEYEKYTNWSSIEKKSRTNSEITTFLLRNIKRYKKPVKLEGITPAGCYLSEEEYSKITNQATT
jgi:hypothetical protein